MKNFLLCLLSFLLFLLPINAQDSSIGNEDIPQQKNQGSEYITNINFIATWPPQALLGVNQNFKIPLMRFDNPLMKDNHINFKIGAEISPVSLGAVTGITWVPVAFMELYTEATVGSGWNIPVKPKDIIGIGINENDSGKTHKKNLVLTNAVYSFSLGGALQFDLGAVIPHDWSHVVFRMDQYALYHAMTGVSPETSWIYKDDSGQNRNGWKYQASYLIGYKMPIFLDLAALKIDTEKKLYASPKDLDRKTWGEDLIYTTFGPIINFNIKKDYNILLLAQWHTKPLYKGGSNDDFYQTRILDTDKKTYVKFYQVGIIFHMNIKR
ncbi:hypothetical protein E4O03_08665 [Treponema sp. OMZ 792]|uniref:hypothetical protein n=1 Tax=unclassified Treponema TaxID=2638727 RepID=UPI0020A30B76|nr:MULTISPECIES: hypothetical protein [unclassified Treponema]UTC74312.1 hypothetical protein E4O03_08665 [Treponema sp. OMZ 792]UTC77404.1 hypothetical protein E4O04_05065 [Treponema sp. OMZ 799]UTC80709.1 hypothetical protein E4O07_08565 [Treponema sp. OMZ 798]